MKNSTKAGDYKGYFPLVIFQLPDIRTRTLKHMRLQYIYLGILKIGLTCKDRHRRHQVPQNASTFSLAFVSISPAPVSSVPMFSLVLLWLIMYVQKHFCCPPCGLPESAADGLWFSQPQSCMMRQGVYIPPRSLAPASISSIFHFYF